MQYNFDEIIDRNNTNSQKWDSATEEDVIPMWVADMDFRAARPILEALEAVIKHGILGYANVPEKYYEAIIHWFKTRHDFTVKKPWILYTIGVIPALSAIIKALTKPGDKILIQTPVYNGFFSIITNNNCDFVASDLIYENGTYHIDFDDLEVKASDPKVKLLLLCNPHNPVGRVWKKEELEKIGFICIRNGILVISDEIHCDLILEGRKHIPFATVNEDFLPYSVTCTSPSKTFNLAGLQVANIFAADENIRQKISQALKANTVHDISPFAIASLVSAYKDGQQWLDQLLPYLSSNYHYLKDFFSEHYPQLKVLTLEATYLVWIDCSALKIETSVLTKKLLQQGKIWINNGKMYGDSGNDFIRINIACPKAILYEGLHRLKSIIDQL